MGSAWSSALSCYWLKAHLICYLKWSSDQQTSTLYAAALITSLHAGKLSMLLLPSADFFQNYLFKKIISGTLSEWQTVWIQIRTDILSVLISVQTVCRRAKQLSHDSVIWNDHEIDIPQVCYCIYYTNHVTWKTFLESLQVYQAQTFMLCYKD